MPGLPWRTSLTLMIILVALAAGAGCIFDPTPRSFSVNTDYKLSILSTEPLYNVTFYLPIPQKNETPMAGPLVLTENYFASQNYSSGFVRSPPGANPDWSVTGIDTEPLYLKVTADMLYPNETFGTSFNFFYENKTVIASPLDFADTLTPLRNGSILLQKVNFSTETQTQDFSKDPTLIRYHELDPMQHVAFYARYSASPDAWVNVYSQVLIMNRWESGGEEKQNFYCDSFGWTNIGEAHGWQTARGIYSSGVGPYPNLSSPVWQDAINATVRQ